MSGPTSRGSDPALPENAPREGDILAGKYRVESVLGVGGMGLVLLVRHIDLGQQMAIKLMMPGVIHDDQASARFVREARSAAAIQSEHVVRIFDVGTFDSGLPYMVMELLRGEDLSQLLMREGRLPLEDAVDYVLQAGHAIAEAHARGIVHRDLKPSNIFVTTRSNGTALVKVLDFGISKAMNPDIDGPSSANLTATCAIMGSPLYMSPEQVRNAKLVDARTDIWALGVILHELLTGAPAFSADTLPGICAAITADDPPPLRSLREDASPELEAAVAKCLEKNVTKRYQSTRELMNALRAFASSTGRVEPTSLPAAMTMREAGSLPPGALNDPEGARTAGSPNGNASRPSRDGMPRSRTSPRSSGAKQVHGESPRPSGKMQGATSLATSSATVSWRQDGEETSGPKGRKIVTWRVGLALVAGGAIGALMFARSDHREPVSAPVAAATPAFRRSFVLFLDATPAGAEIWEGGERIGEAPMQLSLDNDRLREKQRTFVVRRAGFQPQSIMQGPSDENVRTLASLVPVPRETETPAAPPPPLPAPTGKDRVTAPTLSKPAKGAPPRADPAATIAPPTPPAATPAASPPAAPSDIRLQR